MMKKIALFALLAILFGCAFAQDAVESSIKLSIYPSSSNWWVAVDPVGDGNATVKLHLQEAGSEVWQEMAGNPSWGYWQLAASHENGYALPLSFQLTDNEGETLQISSAVSEIGGGEVDTDQQFSSNNNGHHANPPTQAPTKKATPAPTKKPGKATPAPTPAPTKKPGKATSAPTPAPTQKPGKATPAPTTKPSKTPTSAPTTKPSSGASGNTGATTALCSVVPVSAEPVKLLVPLYVDPGKEWDELITAAATGVPIMAIINPNDGPVSGGPDSSYKTYMQKFADAGIEMVGYVHTLYGERSLSEVEADVALYASKYPGLIGIFVDEASPDASELSYYTSLYNNIKSHSGYVNVIVNPGIAPDQGYMNAATNLMIFENPASTWKGNFASWVGCAPTQAQKSGYKYRFSGVSYNTAQAQMPTLVAEMAAAGIGMVYVTDGADECCVYNDLSKYFAPLAASVLALNKL